MLILAAVLAAAAAPAAAAPFFAPDSVWNTPVDPAAAIDPNSPTMVAELTREATQWGAWINTTQYSTPIYTVAADQPTVAVKLDQPSQPMGDTAQRLSNAFAAVPLPPGAHPATGTDGHLVVWQPSTDTMWEFWRLSLQSDGWHAPWGGRMTNVSQNPGYFGGFDWSWGATATSLPLVGGLMTIAEQQSGHIDHALAMALPAKYNKFVFPAIRGDGRWGDVRAIPEGAVVRLDPNLDLTTLKMPSYTRMLATAAQKYGIIIRDYATVPAFFGEDPTPTGNNPYPALWGNAWPKNVMAAFPWSRLQVLQLNYDTTPPAWSKVASGPPPLTKSTSHVFTFSASEPTVSYRCRLDHYMFVNCEPPDRISGIKDGTHVLEVRAVDPSGNAQQGPYDSWTWTQDSTGPVLTVTSQPSSLSNSSSATFDWSANESASYECQLDGGGWSSCSPPQTLTGLSDGSHSFSIRGTDGLGNVGAPATVNWTIDTTAPTATITSGPSGYVQTINATFTWQVDEVSTTECRFDAQAWAPCSGSASFMGPDGTHTFEVRATDTAGNVESPPAKRTWTDCTIEGTSGDDVLVGTPGDDVICGLGGNDTLMGGAGNDTLIGGAGNDTLIGGAGNDIMIGNGGIDTASYSDHTQPVRLAIGGGANKGQAGESDDIRSDVENLTGGSGDDTLYGDANANVLDGGPGNDRLVGGAGNDTLLGGAGTDTLQGDAGDDVFSGGAGIDTADYGLMTKPVKVSIGDGPNDGISGEADDVQSDVENIIGGSGGDTLIGSSTANWISGGNGDDTITGGKGQDTLLGGAGNDKFDAVDATKDQVTCGTNFDTVKADSGLDVVASDCEVVG